MKAFVSHLREWLRPLPIRDPVERRMAALLQIILLGFIAILLIAVVVNLILAPDLLWGLVIIRSAIFILVVCIPLVLLRRGYFRASLQLIIALFLFLGTAAIRAAGLRAAPELLSFFTLAIVLAGLLVGRRALLATFAFSGVVLLVSVFQEQTPDGRIDAITIAGNFILLNGLISVFLDQFGFTLHTALNSALEQEAVLQQEVEQRKQAEEALRASQSMFQGLFDSSPDAIIVTNPEGQIVQVNTRLEGLFGYRADELLGQPVEILLPRRSQEIQFPHRSGQIAGPGHQSMEMGFELYGRRKDGSEFPVEINRGTLESKAGPVVLSTLRDITERKRAEEALRQRELEFRTLAEGMPDIVARFDPQLRHVYVNDVVENITGIPAKSFIGQTNHDLRMPENQDALWEQSLRSVFENGQARTIEFEFSSRMGRRYFESRLVPERGTTGKVERVLSIARDITERKRAEEALREKERFLSEAQRIGKIGSWRYDISADRVFFTDEMYSLLDIAMDAFQHNGEGFLSLVYSPDRPMVASWLEDIRVRGQIKDIEFLVFRKNGELRYIRCRGAVEFDATGKPARFIGTGQDVTERKLAEIQIRQQVERLTALRKIDQAISSSFDLRVTLEILISQVTSQLQVDAADVLLLEPDNNSLTFAAGKGFRTRAVESARLQVSEIQAAKERRLIQVASLKHKPDVRLLTPAGNSEGFETYLAAPLLVKGRLKGVLEVFHRTPLHPYEEWLDFFNTLAGQAAIAVETATLFDNLERSNHELSQAYDATIEGWSRALDLRDKETEGHTQRVTEMTIRLARAFGLPEEEILHIRRGALLHDIGKMGVPDHILLKSGELTEEEWAQMRTHPEYAYNLLKPIAFLRPALDIPLCHHEKRDGSGYPRGLKGQEIPLAARLFMVVDVWDALRSDRPYRLAWTREKALDYIRSLSGTHFDPKVVDAFLEIIKE